MPLFVMGQTAKRAKAIKKPEPVATPQPAVVEPTPKPAAGKKNERPAPVEQPAIKTSSISASFAKPAYSYEFTRPEFLVSYVLIEHDEAGKGKITFRKKDMDEPESDPITVSPDSLERIQAAFKALNFLDSTESYQYAKDYSHLGNVSITYRKDGKERTAKFNWTDNVDAKTIYDEYRKIGYQYVWQFDMSIARQNQPLEAPSLMDELDSLIRRNEISDASQMIPLLEELSNDERIPLIARNHATKLVQTIRKQKK
jgi:hypothetical protein